MADQEVNAGNKGVGEPTKNPKKGTAVQEVAGQTKDEGEPAPHGNKIGKHTSSHAHDKFLHKMMPEGY